jgi:hypothetical protein
VRDGGHDGDPRRPHGQSGSDDQQGRLVVARVKSWLRSSSSLIRVCRCPALGAELRCSGDQHRPPCWGEGHKTRRHRPRTARGDADGRPWRRCRACAPARRADHAGRGCRPAAPRQAHRRPRREGATAGPAGPGGRAELWCRPTASSRPRPRRGFPAHRPAPSEYPRRQPHRSTRSVGSQPVTG